MSSSRDSQKTKKTSFTSRTSRGTLNDTGNMSIISSNLTLKTDTPDNLIVAERVRDMYKGE